MAAADDDWSDPGPPPVASATFTREPGESGPEFAARAEAEPPPDLAETRPRNVPVPRGAAARSRWTRAKGKAAPKRGAAKAKAAKHPRVPVDELIAGVYRAGAGILGPMLPATARMLKIQSATAGILLDPIVRDTIADRFLQPLARTSAGAEAVAVLVGPPLIVAAIETSPERAVILMPVLRELLVRMCKIAGPGMREAMARQEEAEEQFGMTVDMILATLAATLPGPQEEEAAVRDTQEAMADAGTGAAA